MFCIKYRKVSFSPFLRGQIVRYKNINPITAIKLAGQRNVVDYWWE